MTIGERLSFLRENHLHISQEELGSKIGVSRFSISNYESGKRNLTDRVISDICREYNINEEWLRTGEGEMFKKSSDEIGYYVEELLEYDGHGNPFYDMIIEMMKTYHGLDEKSKNVMREYFLSIGKALERKKKVSIPSDPEELERQYPPVDPVNIEKKDDNTKVG